MHAGNRHPVMLHYRLPTWNAFYYIRNFAEEFWTSFCRHFSSTDTSWTSNMQVNDAFVSVSRKKKWTTVDFSKQAGFIRHHTTVVATPRTSDTRQRIAEHFHWLTDITCLSRNTRCYSQVFNHCDFSGHGRFFLKGSVHTILFYSIRVTIWRHRVAASQPRGGVAIIIIVLASLTYFPTNPSHVPDLSQVFGHLNS